MSPRPQLGLVVPVFDESGRFDEFGKLLADYVAEHAPGSQLLFVDDGSTDATPQRIHSLIDSRPDVEVRLLARPHQGKGAAVAAGLRALTADYLAFCDLDLSTPLDQLSLVVDTAARAPVLAIGSRDLTTSRLLEPEGRIREALGRSYNRLLQATVTPGIVDTQCGAKAARRDVWAAVLAHTTEAGFAWDAEAVAVALALDISVQEVAIDWRHDHRSKVHVLRDGARMVAATRRIRETARAARVAAGPEAFSDLRAAQLAGSDSSHWWFRSKAAYVATALRRTVPDGDVGWLVDAGGGAGGVTALLGWRSDRVLVAEASADLSALARRRHALASTRATLPRLPVRDGGAGVVSLLDVLEHLDDPGAALSEARRVLGPGGRLVVTVPAHPWLWSATDVHLGHRRRYRRRDLRRALSESGFEVVVITHVFGWLVPAVAAVRLWLRSGTVQLGLERRSPTFDLVALVLTAVERQLIGRASSPAGTSLLAVAVVRD